MRHSKNINKTLHIVSRKRVVYFKDVCKLELEPEVHLSGIKSQEPVTLPLIFLSFLFLHVSLILLSFSKCLLPLNFHLHIALTWLTPVCRSSNIFIPHSENDLIGSPLDPLVQRLEVARDEDEEKSEDQIKERLILKDLNFYPSHPKLSRVSGTIRFKIQKDFSS